MAFKLNKKQIAERDEHAQKLTELKDKLEAAIETYNTEVSKLFAPIEIAAGAYNEAVAEIAEWRDEIVGNWQSEFDDKSERWQEGDNGQAAQELINEWENLSLKELKIEEPEEFSVEFGADGETLEGLSTERG